MYFWISSDTHLFKDLYALLIIKRMRIYKNYNILLLLTVLIQKHSLEKAFNNPLLSSGHNFKH